MQAVEDWKDALGILSAALVIIAAIICVAKTCAATFDPTRCRGFFSES